MTYHLIFDGVNDKIVIPPYPSLNNLPLGDFTIDFSGAIPADNTEGYVCAKSDAGYTGWEMYIYNPSGISLLLTTDGYGDYVERHTHIPDNNIHHYELVWLHDDQDIKIFIDGIEATYSSQSGIGSLTGTYDDDSNNPLAIGAHPFNDYFLDYQLNWFRISNVALHTSNFVPPDLYVAPYTDENTVLLLSLDEGSNDTAFDYSQYGNMGLITGATWELDEGNNSMGFIINGKDFVKVTGTGEEGDPYQLVITMEEFPALDSIDINSISMPSTLRNGSVNVTTPGTRVQLSVSSVALSNGVTVKAKDTNVGKIYVGNSTVSSSNGYILGIGEEVVIIIDDLSKIYIDSASASDGVTYIGS